MSKDSTCLTGFSPSMSKNGRWAPSRLKRCSVALCPRCGFSFGRVSERGGVGPGWRVDRFICGLCAGRGEADVVRSGKCLPGLGSVPYPLYFLCGLTATGSLHVGSRRTYIVLGRRMFGGRRTRRVSGILLTVRFWTRARDRRLVDRSDGCWRTGRGSGGATRTRCPPRLLWLTSPRVSPRSSRPAVGYIAAVGEGGAPESC
ncbi:b24.1 [miniopterid betaherpesvirus 1]|uniref:B24.1 n=1 Tax=miniopterid betaherpesvirus 1 TaxID=3070189 RepID=I3VPZ3_9BETA|nr:b24.1 [miniopterid betaherpesvirus 1]AFK83837.1 b24.1 [miniopterid betaherpesvirus 1]